MTKPRDVTKSVSDMVFVQKLSLCKTAFEVRDMTVYSVNILDYRNRTDSNKSIITVEIELEDVIHEWKYDYGDARENTLEDVVNMILESKGQKTLMDEENKTLILLNAPSLLEIVTVYLTVFELGGTPSTFDQ